MPLIAILAGDGIGPEVTAEARRVLDRLGLDLYLVALITFGLRIFNNVALIRRHYI